MSLTKKHFKEIAGIISDSIEREGYSMTENGKKETMSYLIAKDLSNYFKTLNPQFDEVKFKEACLK